MGFLQSYVGHHKISPRATMDLILFGETLKSTDYDNSLIIIVSLINFLGVGYYQELKNQGFNFSEEIEQIVSRKIRSEKIDEILE